MHSGYHVFFGQIRLVDWFFAYHAGRRTRLQEIGSQTGFTVVTDLPPVPQHIHTKTERYL